MKYLITGGAGFIGSHLTSSLLADGHEVSILDDFSTGSRKNLEGLSGNPQLKVTEYDVASGGKLLNQEIRDADAVIHLAAAVGVDLVVTDPVRTIMTNVKGTEKVLLAAAEYKKRVIIASTSEVYGKSSKESFSEEDDLLIGPSTRSRWSYACSKLLDEFLLMALADSKGLPGTVVRFFNTVGPRQTGRYGMVVPRFVKAALEGQDLHVFGDGEQSRCFCHVCDVVRALRLILPDMNTVGQIYNIGSRELVTIRQLAETVIKVTGSISKIVAVPYEKAYAKGFEDMRRRKPDTSKLREHTGWKPEKSLLEIITDVRDEMLRSGEVKQAEHN